MIKELKQMPTCNLIRMLERVKDDEDLKFILCIELSGRISDSPQSRYESFMMLMGEDIEKKNNVQKTL